MKNSRIYLLGFMGAGKSHLGRLISREFGYNFVDLDEYILMQTSFESISEIFEKKGEPYFRTLERKALEDSNNWNNTVVATGGGSPCQGDNMQLIKEFGFSLFLDPDIDILIERLLPERNKRPLIAALHTRELKAFIKNLLKERRPYYEQADFSTKKTSPEQILLELKQRL